MALLDLDDPRQVIRRSDDWIFGPKASYERSGDVPGVTFPTGIIVDPGTGDLRMYYGAADSTVAVATSKISDLLQALISSH
jgi:predicted GH43/DUF377 family glycosyl hydrolase